MRFYSTAWLVWITAQKPQNRTPEFGGIFFEIVEEIDAKLLRTDVARIAQLFARARETLERRTSGFLQTRDAEIREVDAFVRRNMVEKFGPVRTVKPELVFELAFEGLNLSKRHKSGIAVRFPRILRWRNDKPAVEADTLDSVRALLAPEPPA